MSKIKLMKIILPGKIANEIWNREFHFAHAHAQNEWLFRAADRLKVTKTAKSKFIIVLVLLLLLTKKRIQNVLHCIFQLDLLSAEIKFIMKREIFLVSISHDCMIRGSNLNSNIHLVDFDVKTRNGNHIQMLGSLVNIP